ncbi:uncharacterized protein LOC112460711 isoform X1 [Temnothorax curvispinosus]|uniref:Uncharacterized protein LOC112460711 isoform X1 n=1 Tax=Temnothorax curvispinosus TaxID=300111 RepID=A0A6J1QG08_9HYME|nr:uncharacterized protein LOC112460711 isoform X1 [Temnothorax curvispinosus]
MEFRTAAEARYSFRPRKIKEELFGDDPSDEEDIVEDQETSDTEQEFDNDDDSLFEIKEEDLHQIKEEEAALSESEQVATSTIRRQRSFVYGKNKHEWCLRAPETGGQPSKTVIYIPAPKNGAVNASSPVETWSCLFTDEMIDMIVQHTNKEIERHVQEMSTNDRTYSTTATEIKAFIGLLYFAGVKKSAHVNIEELWSTEFGHALFKAVMCSRRFGFLAARLRFDDKNTRAERRKHDLLAPIRDLWEKFIQNCMTNYTPSEEMTVDKQLFGFRGKFPAKVYIKSKERYGIKIMCLNDATTYYLYNALPYVGKENTLADESIPSYYVRTICQPIYGSNRILTCDNWFTSIEIFDKMLKEYSLSMVGTISKNKQHLPESFKRTAAAGTVRYAYDSTKTLISYCPKKNKVVLLLSSLHQNGKSDPVSGRPQIVEFYNRTKEGTNGFSQFCSLYSCSRGTQRWPMRFFMGMLDQAGVNSGILFNLLPTNAVLDQREFMKELVLALVTPYLRERAQMPTLRRDIKENILKILGVDDNPKPGISKTDKLLKRKRCSMCPTKLDRKVGWCCYVCGRAVCEEHRRMICINCIE